MRRKEGNVLVIWCQAYVKDHLDSERKPAAATWATLSD